MTQDDDVIEGTPDSRQRRALAASLLLLLLLVLGSCSVSIFTFTGERAQLLLQRLQRDQWSENVRDKLV